MEQNQKKTLSILKESFLMYERSIKEAQERLKEAMLPDGTKKFKQEDIDMKIKQLREMQNDIKDKYVMCGGDVEDLHILEKGKENTTTKPKAIVKPKKTTKANTEKKVKPIVKPKKVEVKDEVIEKTIKEEYQTNQIEPPIIDLNNIDFSATFDVIPLPSKGECYENSMKNIAVSYLTANDENMIVSPNLYKDGLILDYLLRSKIRNTDIDPDDLLEGDRDAIILWLRATGYGLQYPITVTDNVTGVEFDTTVDLSQIKHKPFLLKGDENGYFDFMTPNSKDLIKFKFLTHGDIKYINSIETEEQVNVKKNKLSYIVREIGELLENEENLSKDDKMKLYEAKRNINKWAESIDTTSDEGYTHKLTNRLEMSIISINGEDDREYISEYVRNMNVRDALALRRYINDNEPGLDFLVTVERPESLGGGSMPVFLSLDEYVFLNIA